MGGILAQAFLTSPKLMMAWLVACSVPGFNGWLGDSSSWRPLTLVGQISYGIYVYHILVAISLQPFFAADRFQELGAFSHNLRFLVLLVVTIFVASLSWHYLERPLMKIRERIIGWFLPAHWVFAGKS